MLSSIAWPSFQGALHKARRTDALVALTQVQAAQERWRANHRSYGSLAELARCRRAPAAATTRWRCSTPTSDRYELIARATGTQARDIACRVLQADASTARRAPAPPAPTTLVANDAAANRRCWGLLSGAPACTHRSNAASRWSS